ncbi:glycosyltransferase family 4 protein [Candidatus Woesearchaeota archaeon]|nr:glycosyltransferase family 4 protein [Candidatus Woesearchaeota archaeon]
MRILIIGWRDIMHPKAGGMELVAYEEAKYFIKWGHEVIWLTQRFKGCKRKEKIDGINIIRVGGDYSTYLMAPLYYLSHLRDKIDVLIENNIGLPYFTPFFCWKPKVVITHHLIKDMYFVEAGFPLSNICYFIENTLAPKLYWNEQFVAVSEATKKDMIVSGYNPKKISIVHNGLNHEIYKPGNTLKSKKFHLVYVGGIKKYKRIDILLDAFEKIESEVPNVHLDLIGAFDYVGGKNPYMSQVKRYRLEKKVTFHGFLSDDEKVRILQRGHIFVSASGREGWGLVILEANACGLPAVVLDLPAFRESIKDGKTGLIANSVDEFAIGIIGLLKDENKLRKMSKDAIDWSKEFNWENSARQVLKIIEDQNIEQR